MFQETIKYSVYHINCFMYSAYNGGASWQILLKMSEKTELTLGDLIPNADALIFGNEPMNLAGLEDQQMSDPTLTVFLVLTRRNTQQRLGW